MSKLDGDDGKPFLYTRQMLNEQFIQLSGEYFGRYVLEEQTKDEPVLQMMNKMFGGTVDTLPEHLQELWRAIKLLESAE